MDFFTPLLSTLLMWTLLLSGCAPSSHTVTGGYIRNDKKPAVLDPAESLVIYLPPVSGSAGRTWYRIGETSWHLDREPTALAREALSEELRSMGITVTADPSAAPARLEAELRWMAPDGGFPLSAGVILSVSLWEGDESKPRWFGKLHGGSFSKEPLLVTDVEAAMGEHLSRALTNALHQLRWKPGFTEAIMRLVHERCGTR